MKTCLLLALASFSLVACSNPFSSQRPTILEENTKPLNTACSGIRLDQSEVTPAQVRAVVHCLNQNSELKELEQWTTSISDEEWAPLLSSFNAILKSEPAFLFASKEIYVQGSRNGDLQNLLDQLFSKVKTETERRQLVTLVQKHSRWIGNFIRDHGKNINFGRLPLLSEVKSFHRGVDEQFKSGELKGLLDSLVKYRRQKESLSFQELYDFFSAVDPSVVGNRKKAEQISGFINWLLEEKRIETFSLAVDSLTQKPISCFHGGKSISDSLPTLLQELRTMKPSDFPEFMHSKISAMVLVGKGYCEIPPIVIDAAQTLLQSTEQESLIPFFELIQPLFKDPRFVQLLSSSSFRTLTTELARSNHTHLFQDFLTLVNWLRKNPILENRTAEVLDSAFDEFSAEEFWFLTNLAPTDVRFYRSLEKIARILPPLKTSLFSSEDSLTIFGKSSFAPVLELASKMNDEKKIFPILDRLMEVFKVMFEKGRNEYRVANALPPRHDLSSASQSWELPFWQNKEFFSLNQTNCSQLNLEASFFQTGSSNSPDAILTNLDALASCFGANRSFLGIRDLASYLLTTDPSGQSYNRVSSLQDGLFSFIFTLDSREAFETLNRALTFDSTEVAQLKKTLRAASATLSVTREPLKKSTEIRKLLAKYLRDRKTYSLFRTSPENLAPPFQNLSLSLTQIALSALPSLMKEHCPNLDTDSSDCDVDPDQVNSYRVSPEKLAAQMAEEYLSSSQSWLHPLHFKKWNTEKTEPKNVSFLNFHLDSLLRQIDKSPKSGAALFEFMKRNQGSKRPLLSFLRDRARSVQVIPYIFNRADYPATKRELHEWVRFRIVTDIDRLELLAINADFKPFGKIKNFGMTFVREIATSWGDVPAANRPSFGTSETLSQARASILKEFDRFNLDILDKIGSCDPRGRNRLGRWIKGKLCGGEIGDIRARLFNLESMLTILDRPDDLVLLRDLFYSLYESNSNEQRGQFVNGVEDTGNESYEDRLELIPKICRLGLLHQAALSLLRDDSIVPESVIAILNRSVRENRVSAISSVLVSTEGQTIVRDLLDFLMSSDDKEKENVASAVRTASQVGNQQWLSFSLELLSKNPKTISTFSAFLHEGLKKFDVSPASAEILVLLTSLSNDLKGEALLTESSNLVKSLSKVSGELPDLLSFRPKKDLLGQWPTLLEREDRQKERDQIASFVTGSGFEDFCDVFSDSSLVDKTYIFLEGSNQNSGITELLEECRLFLH